MSGWRNVPMGAAEAVVFRWSTSFRPRPFTIASWEYGINRCGKIICLYTTQERKDTTHIVRHSTVRHTQHDTRDTQHQTHSTSHA